VRGAVTLAGVLTLPLALHNGVPFPARDLAILLAAGVIVVSLVVASAALPRLLRGLDLPADKEGGAVEEDTRRAAAQAALHAIQAARSALAGASGPPTPLRAAVAARLVALYRQRIVRHVGAAPAERRADRAQERELRLVGLRAEREEVLRYGRAHGLDELVLRRIVRELDFQEARYGA
jgi:CPA1 family monovalent cation:H+ antiporter